MPNTMMELRITIKFPEGTSREVVERARHSMDCEADDWKVIANAKVEIEIVETEEAD